MNIIDEATEFIKGFSVDWAIEHYHKDISEKICSYFANHTPETWRKLINDVKPFELPEEFYQFMNKYREHIKSMTPEEHAELFLELIMESRPDLADVILKSSEDGKERIWFFRCVELTRERIINPERYMEATQSPMSSVKCDACGESFIISKENAAKLKGCPFCGASSKEEK